MSVRNGGGGSWPHAAAILAGSWSGSTICTLVNRVGAGARSARASRLSAHICRMFTTLPRVERYAILSLVILVAVAGHLAMAWLLAPAARPTPILSAGALLAAGLTAVAASGHGRRPRETWEPAVTQVRHRS